jgi:hypothetical protein
LSDILPEGESLRRAVRWISGQLEEDPERAVMPLVNQATLRFDLTPRQAEYLIHFYRERRSE